MTPDEKIQELSLREELSALTAKKLKIEQRLQVIYKAQEQEIEEKICLAYQGKGSFADSDLVFAAIARCCCGAGLAYPNNIGAHGAWHCSDILMGKARKDALHEGKMPFAFYSIKSEDQPSANGQTTRIKDSKEPAL